jgi:hypothetical protein
MAKKTAPKAPKAAPAETEIADNTPEVAAETFARDDEYDPSSPNSQLNLSQFNYEGLTGESFKEYVSLVGDRSFIELNDEGRATPVTGKLMLQDKYDFVLLPAVPVMKVRYPGVKDSPIDYVGIKAKTLQPIHKTRIPVSAALEYNAQIINQHSRAGHGKYYFLAKN